MQLQALNFVSLFPSKQNLKKNIFIQDQFTPKTIYIQSNGHFLIVLIVLNMDILRTFSNILRCSIAMSARDLSRYVSPITSRTRLCQPIISKLSIEFLHPQCPIILREMLYSQYFHNKFYVTGYYGLLVGYKSNFSDRFKLESITTKYL